MNDPSPSSFGSAAVSISAAAAAVGCAAAAAALGLVAMQTDAVSRTLLLSPDRLHAKRHAQYLYKWRRALDRASRKLRIRFLTTDDDSRTSTTTTTAATPAAQFNEDQELLQTSFFSSKKSKDGGDNTDQFDELISKIVAAGRQRRQKRTASKSNGDSSDGGTASARTIFRFGRIGRPDDDAGDRGDREDSMEYYLWLYEYEESEHCGGDDDDDDGTIDPISSVRQRLHRRRIYRLPLSAFCDRLYGALQRQIDTRTFCFVADACGGRATQFVVDLVREASSDLRGRVFVATSGGGGGGGGGGGTPLWMAGLAAVVEKRVLPRESLERALFAGCRMEASRAPPPPPSSTTGAGTVLIPVDTAVGAVLLPLLHNAFPDDHHVFAYGACTNAVRYAYTTSTSAASSKRHREEDKERSKEGYVPTDLDDAFEFRDRRIASATPLQAPSALSKSTHVMNPYLGALSKLPLDVASAVETWMGCVHAFFLLKEQNEDNKTGKGKFAAPSSLPEYVPYVFKLEYLLPPPSTSPASATAEIDVGSDRYWSLRSLLQYVTGSQSRELPPETMDAAVSWLQDYCAEHQQHMASSSYAMSGSVRKGIENAVFQHKLILIENKTIKDTVQPAQHWTLKAALKRGCACCAPEDDEEEEQEAERRMMMSMAAAGTGSRVATTSVSGMAAVSSTTFLPPTMPAPAAAAAGGSDNNDSSTKGTVSAANSSKGSSYVDGKTSFAFDPTRFS